MQKKLKAGPPPTSVLPNTGMQLGKTSHSAIPSVPYSEPDYFKGKIGQNAKLSSGPFGDMKLEYTEPLNQTIGWQSNPTVSDTIMLPEYHYGLMNFGTENLILFVNKNSKNHKAVFSEPATHCCVDLISFNFLYAKFDDDTKGQTAAEIWDNWTVGGVVATDDGVKLKTYNGVYRSRAVVIDKQGWRKTHNIWGNGVRKGIGLYFIFKRVEIRYDTVFELGNDSFTSRQMDQTIQKKKFMPFQLVPWVGFYPPPLSQTRYKNYNGEWENGVWIQIGRSDENLTLNSMAINDTTSNAIHSVIKYTKRATMQIILDVGMPHCGE